MQLWMCFTDEFTVTLYKLVKQYNFNSILLSLAWKKSNLYFLLVAVKHN